MRAYHCLLVLCLCATAGCSSGTKIYVKQANYTPVINFNTVAYKGQRVYLMDVENQAENTSMWYYYSPDQAYKYEGAPFIRSYFWYCFEKALLQTGMLVSSSDNPDLTAPAVQFIMKSTTDEQFVFEVKVFKRKAAIFSQTYTITEAPLPRAQQSPQTLEKRSYQMVNKTVQAVFADAKFKRAFLSAR